MSNRPNKFTRVYRSQQTHQRVSSAVTVSRERKTHQFHPIEYPVQPPTDSTATMAERHIEFRHQQKLNDWQSRYNFLQRNYDAQRDKLEELAASHEKLKKQLAQTLRNTRKYQQQSQPNLNRTSVQIYEKESEKGELVMLRRENQHLQQSLSGCRKQLKENRQRYDHLLEVVHSQQDLIGKLKQNLTIAVQNNTGEVQLIPYNIRIPKFDAESTKSKEAD